MAPTDPKAPIAAFKDLVVDAVDPRVLAEFWAGTLQLEVAEVDDTDGNEFCVFPPRG